MGRKSGAPLFELSGPRVNFALHACTLAGCALLSAGASIVLAGCQKGQPDSHVAVEGTRFVLHTPSGERLRSEQLIGTIFHVGEGNPGLAIRFRAVRPDIRWGHALALHQFEVRTGKGWQNPCRPDPVGRSEGFPLAGISGEDGSLNLSDARHFEIVCTSGAQGKCVRLGYFPWKSDEMLAAFNACVRAIRADYIGNGSSFTVDGTTIEVFDRLGINRQVNHNGLRFEAGWLPSGAVCLHHFRIRDRRPRELSANAQCDEVVAGSKGAVVFTLSKP